MPAALSSLAPAGREPDLAPVAFASPAELRAAALDADEIAVVDVREGDAYLSGHVSIAVELPYGEIERTVARLLPRRDVRLFVTDADGGPLAAAAARRLAELGYADVRVLQGGLTAWAAAGNELVTGQFSLSKALGEFVERTYETPKISVDALHARIAAGEALVILDTRPLDEFNHISIPGGIAAPGVELLYRAFDAVPSPETPVVVNCAGRTRAIIGAQALINAGFPNPVVSLENGTSAWLLAGYAPARGETRAAAAPSPEGIEKARAAAEGIAARFSIPTLDRAALDARKADAGRRTFYLFDVRTPEEYAAGHLPGALSAPGGQLVQTTDRFVGVRQAEIVLADDADLVRARLAAHWLYQQGLPRVAVYAAAPQELSETGFPPVEVLGSAADVKALAPAELQGRLAAGSAVVIDVEPAPPYYRTRRHVPGSIVARRSTLPALVSRIPGAGAIVLTSSDGISARFAAAELARHTPRPVLALDGGTDGWIAAGLDTATGLDQASLDPAERLPQLPTLEERRVNLDAYVRWGDHIGAQLERDGLAVFRRAPQ